MPLQRYSEESFGIAQELADSLDDEQIAALRDLLLSLGGRRWLDWRATHTERVASFVSAAPAARAKRKLPPSDRLLLSLAAYQCCVDAGELLHQAAQLRPGGSYRQMTAVAGMAYQRMTDEARRAMPEWPWGDPDPFDDPGFWGC